jgi:hypothetical protein
MTCTVCAMLASVVPHSCVPSRDELCSQGFCDPGAACRSTMTPSSCFLPRPSSTHTGLAVALIVDRSLKAADDDDDVLCPSEGVVQGLEGASDVRSGRAGVAGDPPSDRDPHCGQPTRRKEPEVVLHYVRAPMLLQRSCYQVQLAVGRPQSSVVFLLPSAAARPCRRRSRCRAGTPLGAAARRWSSGTLTRRSRTTAWARRSPLSLRRSLSPAYD